MRSSGIASTQVETGSEAYTFSYDPASDVWSYLSDRASGTWQNCMAEIGGKIYIAGGTPGPNGDFVPMASLEIFDPTLE